MLEFDHTDIEVLNAVALTRNLSLNRVLKKCGFELLGSVIIDDREHYHYQLKK